MSYRVEISVIDLVVRAPRVGSDRPEVVYSNTISTSNYHKLALAQKLAQRVAEWGITNERAITGKGPRP